ncbi:hypothetical protein JT359_02310 [Candidatus Poribacteria bacterium]|nr:hypothetical protein [Candidatus Poribacteria bacterium]
MSYFSEPWLSVLCQRLFYTPFAPLELAYWVVWGFYTHFAPLELAYWLIWGFYTHFAPLEIAEIQRVRSRKSLLQ